MFALFLSPLSSLCITWVVLLTPSPDHSVVLVFCFPRSLHPHFLPSSPDQFHLPPAFDIPVHHQSSTRKWGDRSCSVLVNACSRLPLPTSWSILCWQKSHRRGDFLHPDTLVLCPSCTFSAVNVFFMVFKLELFTIHRCGGASWWIMWLFIVPMATVTLGSVHQQRACDSFNQRPG